MAFISVLQIIYRLNGPDGNCKWFFVHNCNELVKTSNNKDADNLTLEFF